VKFQNILSQFVPYANFASFRISLLNHDVTPNEGMVPLPDFDIKTNNVINEVLATTSEIVDILKIINPNKASGPNKISHKKLKISPEKIVIPLQIIFNKSLRQCKYPSILKNAHVTAIFIKGDT
jgi:hypothetical protein